MMPQVRYEKLFEKYPPTAKDDYLATWTTNLRIGDASPIYFLNKNAPPFLIYVGDKTYPSITVANDRFLKALKPYQPKVELFHLNKSMCQWY
jgi:hypothetical protein